MDTRIYVSNIEASYFNVNSLLCASDIPKEGQHEVGDIVISNIQQNEIIGWVCVKKGEPGEWKSIRNAGDWLQVELAEINENISEIRIHNNETNENLILLGQKIDKNVKAIDNNKTSINHLNNDMKVVKNDILEQGNVIGEIEGSISSINSQINVTNQALTDLTTQVTNNKKNLTDVTEKANKVEQAIENINTQVGENGVASKDSLDQAIVQIEKIKEKLGSDTEADLLDQSVYKEIDLLKELIGANSENFEESQGGIIQEINELRELIGVKSGEDEGARESLLDEIEAIKNLIGQAEGGTQGGILEEISDIKNAIGLDANGETPATGLQKEIDDIENEIDDIIESIEVVKDELLKFWVGTQKEYNALSEKEPGRLYIIVE